MSLMVGTTLCAHIAAITEVHCLFQSCLEGAGKIHSSAAQRAQKEKGLTNASSPSRTSSLIKPPIMGMMTTLSLDSRGPLALAVLAPVPMMALRPASFREMTSSYSSSAPVSDW